MKAFVNGRLNAIPAVWNGFVLLFQEQAFRLMVCHHLLLAIFAYNISVTLNRGIILLAISLFSLSFEALNSTVEDICDFIHPKKNEHIKRIKDISAAAAFLAQAICAVPASWTIIYLEYTGQ